METKGNTMRPQSKYLPAWEKLKKEKILKITANPKYHSMIIKGLQHRRDADIAYKMALEESFKKHRMVARSNETVITFRLYEYLTIYGI